MPHHSKLDHISRLLSSDMERKNLRARTVAVKVQLHTFNSLSRACTLNKRVYVQSAADMQRIASELLIELKATHFEKTANSKVQGSVAGPYVFSARRLGIRCSNLLPGLRKPNTYGIADKQ